MPWVETTSLSFTARHEASHTEDAEEVLAALEDAFDQPADEVERRFRSHLERLGAPAPATSLL